MLVYNKTKYTITSSVNKTSVKLKPKLKSLTKENKLFLKTLGLQLQNE